MHLPVLGLAADQLQYINSDNGIHGKHQDLFLLFSREPWLPLTQH